MKAPFPLFPENSSLSVPPVPDIRDPGGRKGLESNYEKMKNEKSDRPISNESTSAAEIWLDKQDILIRMHISSRTLQTWRSRGILPFCRIGRKLYYRESDLNRLYIQYLRNHSSIQ